MQDATGIGKLKPLFGSSTIDVDDRLPAQSPGEFYLLRDGRVTSVRAGLSLIQTRQPAAERLLDLAARRSPLSGRL